MSATTPLDDAHAAMEAAPEADADTARLRFYERLADGELFMLLESEADGDQVTPSLFPVDGQNFVLVFDREDRLSTFAEGAAPYVALSGRMLAGMLDGQGIGLAVNPGAASAILIPADAVTWLAGTLAHVPDEVEERPEEVMRPAGLPEALITALDAKLATAEGLAHSAWLVAVRYGGNRRTHLLAFVDPLPGAEPSLARAAGEALTFSGVEAGSMDIGFFRAADPICARLAKVGLRFDLPVPVAVAQVVGAAPGMDPDKPPRLR